MKKNYKILLIASLLCLIISIVLLLVGSGEKMGPPLVLFFILLALALRGHDSFKGFSFVEGWRLKCICVSGRFERNLLQTISKRIHDEIMHLLLIAETDFMFGTI